VLSLAVIASSTLVALAALACATTLGLHGTLDAASVTAIISGTLGIAGGAGAAKIGADLANGNPPERRRSEP
jgi:hypothetical protein